jgi:hypothetical protein
MQTTTIVSLIGSGIACSAFAWRRQWIISLGYFFSLAYTIFDKVFPSVLPEEVVISFSFIFFALALVFCWQTFSRKRTA